MQQGLPNHPSHLLPSLGPSSSMQTNSSTSSLAAAGYSPQYQHSWPPAAVITAGSGNPDHASQQQQRQQQAVVTTYPGPAYLSGPPIATVTPVTGALYSSGSGSSSGQLNRVTQGSVAVKEPPKPRGRSGPKSKFSPFIGVSQYKRTGRWEAHIWDSSSSIRGSRASGGKSGKGKQLHLGSFLTAAQAARAYDRAALLLRGPHAALNFPLEDYSNDPVLEELSHMSRTDLVLALRKTCDMELEAAALEAFNAKVPAAAAHLLHNITGLPTSDPGNMAAAAAAASGDLGSIMLTDQQLLDLSDMYGNPVDLNLIGAAAAGPDMGWGAHVTTTDPSQQQLWLPEVAAAAGSTAAAGLATVPMSLHLTSLQYTPAAAAGTAADLGVSTDLHLQQQWWSPDHRPSVHSALSQPLQVQQQQLQSNQLSTVTGGCSLQPMASEPVHLPNQQQQQQQRMGLVPHMSAPTPLPGPVNATQQQQHHHQRHHQQQQQQPVGLMPHMSAPTPLGKTLAACQQQHHPHQHPHQQQQQPVSLMPHMSAPTPLGDTLAASQQQQHAVFDAQPTGRCTQREISSAAPHISQQQQQQQQQHGLEADQARYLSPFAVPGAAAAPMASMLNNQQQQQPPVAQAPPLPAAHSAPMPTQHPNFQQQQQQQAYTGQYKQHHPQQHMQQRVAPAPIRLAPTGSAPPPTVSLSQQPSHHERLKLQRQDMHDITLGGTVSCPDPGLAGLNSTPTYQHLSTPLSTPLRTPTHGHLHPHHHQQQQQYQSGHQQRTSRPSTPLAGPTPQQFQHQPQQVHQHSTTAKAHHTNLLQPQCPSNHSAPPTLVFAYGSPTTSDLAAAAATYTTTAPDRPVQQGYDSAAAAAAANKPGSGSRSWNSASPGLMADSSSSSSGRSGGGSSSHTSSAGGQSHHSRMHLHGTVHQDRHLQQQQHSRLQQGRVQVRPHSAPQQQGFEHHLTPGQLQQQQQQQQQQRPQTAEQTRCSVSGGRGLSACHAPATAAAAPPQRQSPHTYMAAQATAVQGQLSGFHIVSPANSTGTGVPVGQSHRAAAAAQPAAVASPHTQCQSFNTAGHSTQKQQQQQQVEKNRQFVSSPAVVATHCKHPWQSLSDDGANAGSQHSAVSGAAAAAGAGHAAMQHPTAAAAAAAIEPVVDRRSTANSNTAAFQFSPPSPAVEISVFNQQQPPNQHAPNAVPAAAAQQLEHALTVTWQNRQSQQQQQQQPAQGGCNQLGKLASTETAAEGIRHTLASSNPAGSADVKAAHSDQQIAMTGTAADSDDWAHLLDPDSHSPADQNPSSSHLEQPDHLRQHSAGNPASTGIRPEPDPGCVSHDGGNLVWSNRHKIQQRCGQASSPDTAAAAADGRILGLMPSVTPPGSQSPPLANAAAAAAAGSQQQQHIKEPPNAVAVAQHLCLDEGVPGPAGTTAAASLGRTVSNVTISNICNLGPSRTLSSLALAELARLASGSGSGEHNAATSGFLLQECQHLLYSQHSLPGLDQFDVLAMTNAGVAGQQVGDVGVVGRDADAVHSSQEQVNKAGAKDQQLQQEQTATPLVVAGFQTAVSSRATAGMSTPSGSTVPAASNSKRNMLDSTSGTAEEVDMPAAKRPRSPAPASAAFRGIASTSVSMQPVSDCSAPGSLEVRDGFGDDSIGGVEVRVQSLTTGVAVPSNESLSWWEMMQM